MCTCQIFTNVNLILLLKACQCHLVNMTIQVARECTPKWCQDCCDDELPKAPATTTNDVVRAQVKAVAEKDGNEGFWVEFADGTEFVEGNYLRQCKLLVPAQQNGHEIRLGQRRAVSFGAPVVHPPSPSSLASSESAPQGREEQTRRTRRPKRKRTFV